MSNRTTVYRPDSVFFYDESLPPIEGATEIHWQVVLTVAPDGGTAYRVINLAYGGSTVHLDRSLAQEYIDAVDKKMFSYVNEVADIVVLVSRVEWNLVEPDGFRNVA